MHSLNKYADEKPDFKALAAKYPSFESFVTLSENGFANIDFQNADALRALTTVLLKEDWDFEVELRDDRLCPTLANRLDYLLYVLDLEQYLQPPANSSKNSPDTARPTSVLDIGTGHVAIYPLLLHRLRPSSRILATECDDESLTHSRQTIIANHISEDSIQLIKAPDAGEILFPLRDQQVDFVICNPPFFSSVEEMQQGQELKSGPAPAAPTAASNELITRGGEVAFVGQMIVESLNLRNRCKWFTSLIGKYSSLQPLVEQLRENKIDNYFVKSIRQSRTTRWIIGWSFSPSRLPDSYTRPESIINGTSFTKLLPTSNTLSHTPLHPPFSLPDLREAVLPLLSSVQLAPGSIYSTTQGDGTILLSPRNVTWSRAARRQAAREASGEEHLKPSTAPESTDSTDQPAPSVQNDSTEAEPLFVARLGFESKTICPESRSTSDYSAPEGNETAASSNTPAQVDDVDSATITLEFIWGAERSTLDAFWKFLLTKANLLGSRDQSVRDGTDHGPPPKRARGRGRGRGRGTRGLSRGRGHF